jgi:hypothetical protein
METKIYNTHEMFNSNERNIQKLKRAQKLAWFFFVGIGVTYIVMTLIENLR